MNDNYLPQHIGVPAKIRSGRNVHDGYQRGCGLQFSDLQEKIRQDPLYKKAMKIAHGRTIMTEHNRMNIYLILKFYLDRVPFGHVVEFGSYLGGNALFMASVAKELYPDMRIYALDTFAGMPATDKAVDAHNPGDFSDVNLDELKAYAQKQGLDNLVLIQGLFEETAIDVLNDAGRVSLAHIDCDIYSAVKYSYEVVKPFMVDGGYVVLDDATVSSCIGATEVVEDLLIRRDGLNSEQIYPHYVFRIFDK